jgi:hypothetical protein
MTELQIIVGITIGLCLMVLGRRTTKNDGKTNLIKNVAEHEKEVSKSTLGVMSAPIKDLIARANDRLRKRRESNGKNSSGLGDGP